MRLQAGVAPSTTLLEWLRESRHLTGTKEGCNEGDCGACTVLVSARRAGGGVEHKAMNACILLLAQLHGKAVRTIEGIAGPDGTLHPVQAAMVAQHGSQCGFCTPGFVVSMAAAHLNGRRDFDDQFAGNLCRCTGYAPIIRAAEAAADEPVPDWMAVDGAALDALAAGGSGSAPGDIAMPESSDALAAWYDAHPDATLVGGATDVGLWITKQLRTPAPLCFVGRAADLRRIEQTPEGLRIGAAVTLGELGEAMAGRFADFAELIRRFGSVQVRNAATLGGNIANGSPIGDSPPALIALGARVHLRKGAHRRSLALEDFFIDYGQQDRAPGEFIEAVTIPQQPDRLKCYKLSKRFDQDISAVMGAFNIAVHDGKVVDARIAFGGMAPTPRRALQVEDALIGAPWSAATIRAARKRMAEDFSPISDMRASAGYRLQAARNMLTRLYAESQQGDEPTRVLEVQP